jgi:MFS family permease
MNRFIHFIIAALGAVAAALMAVTAGYILANFPIADPIPYWLWNLVFTIMMLYGIGMFVYCVFVALDELFLKPHDTRRITGKRNCCQPRQREYRVTRRPS